MVMKKKKLLKKDIEKVYNKTKRLAFRSFVRGNYNDSLNYIKLCAKIAYDIGFIYCDDELDLLIEQISDEVIPSITIDCYDNKFVFYDYYPNDNRGVSQQYLRALIANKVEFLYIVENYVEDKTKSIINEVSNYDGGELFVIDNKLSYIDKALMVYSRIVKYSPSKALLHLLPWSVTACLVFSKVKELVRYQINLTDHAFWLGKRCFDYVLEFRDYGAIISMERRMIGSDKLIKLPYYPIVVENDFQGFPYEKKTGDVLLLTGGSYYKTFGENFKFYSILKDLLIKNPCLVVFFAGSGDSSYINNFIHDNGFENRLFLLGDRTDLLQVLYQVDIYLGTYPIGGGLMTLYAAIAGKPILAYADQRNKLAYVENLLYDISADLSISNSSLDLFYNEAYKLITDEDYRAFVASKTRGKVIRNDEFVELFKQKVIKNNIDEYFSKFEIDYDYCLDLYLDIESSYYHFIPKSIIKTLGIRSVFMYPNWSIPYILDNFKFMCGKILYR